MSTRTPFAAEEEEEGEGEDGWAFWSRVYSDPQLRTEVEADSSNTCSSLREILSEKTLVRTKIVIENLPRTCSEDELQSILNRVLGKAKVMKITRYGLSEKATVDFYKVIDAEDAIRRLSGHVIHKHQLRVKSYAPPKEKEKLDSYSSFQNFQNQRTFYKEFEGNNQEEITKTADQIEEKEDERFEWWSESGSVGGSGGKTEGDTTPSPSHSTPTPTPTATFTARTISRRGKPLNHNTNFRKFSVNKDKKERDPSAQKPFFPDFGLTFKSPQLQTQEKKKEAAKVLIFESEGKKKEEKKEMKNEELKKKEEEEVKKERERPPVSPSIVIYLEGESSAPEGKKTDGIDGKLSLEKLLKELSVFLENAGLMEFTDLRVENFLRSKGSPASQEAYFLWPLGVLRTQSTVQLVGKYLCTEDNRGLTITYCEGINEPLAYTERWEPFHPSTITSIEGLAKYIQHMLVHFGPLWKNDTMLSLVLKSLPQSLILGMGGVESLRCCLEDKLRHHLPFLFNLCGTLYLLSLNEHRTKAMGALCLSRNIPVQTQKIVPQTPFLQTPMIHPMVLYETQKSYAQLM